MQPRRCVTDTTRVTDRTRIEDLTRRELLMVTAVGALFAACGNKDTVPPVSVTTKTFADLTGTAVEIPVRPERIVSLHDYNVTAIMLSLGVKPMASAMRDGSLSRIAGLYDVSGITSIGDWRNPDIEAIAALAPDLIVGFGTGHGQPAGPLPAETVARLRQIAPTVFIDPSRPVKDVAGDFATVLGVEPALATLQKAYQERVARLRGRYAAKLADLTVSVISLYLLSTRGVVVYDLGEALTEMGVTGPPIVREATGQGGSIVVSEERVREVDADLIVVLRYSDRDPSFRDGPLFGQLRAAKAGQMHEVDGNRWIDKSYGGLNGILDDMERWLATVDTAVAP